MKKNKLSIVFFGSGPVAAESLRLLSQNFDIEAVVTKPTTEHAMSAVVPGATVYCVSDKAELDDLFTTANFQSTLGVLIDFGIIVSKQITEYFQKGIVNSHFSLLPELRGADPISFAILEGKKLTGVSLMLLVEAMDEGPLLAFGEQELDGTETTPNLTNKLIQLSYSLLKDTLPAYVYQMVSPASGVIPTPRTQQEVCESLGKSFKPTYTRKLDKQDGIIDWTKSATQIEREVRAYLEWPKSRTILGEIDVIITQSHALPSKIDRLMPGQLESLDAPIVIACGDGSLCIEMLKPAGKKEMSAKAFLAGYKNRLSLN